MCQAAPVKDRDHCFWHSPEYAEDVAEARRLGGLRRRREVTVSGAYEVNGLETVGDLRRLLVIASLDTLGLENSIARARTLGYLVGVAGKLLETGELEERLAALEAAHGQKTLPESVFDAEPVDTGFSAEVDS
jgi:hypothetical protein